jgi:hypothetical protein
MLSLCSNSTYTFTRRELWHFQRVVILVNMKFIRQYVKRICVKYPFGGTTLWSDIMFLCLLFNDAVVYYDISYFDWTA